MEGSSLHTTQGGRSHFKWPNRRDLRESKQLVEGKSESCVCVCVTHTKIMRSRGSHEMTEKSITCITGFWFQQFIQYSQ